MQLSKNSIKKSNHITKNNLITLAPKRPNLQARVKEYHMIGIDTMQIIIDSFNLSNAAIQLFQSSSRINDKILWADDTGRVITGYKAFINLGLNNSIRVDLKNSLNGVCLIVSTELPKLVSRYGWNYNLINHSKTIDAISTLDQCLRDAGIQSFNIMNARLKRLDFTENIQGGNTNIIAEKMIPIVNKKNQTIRDKRNEIESITWAGFVGGKQNLIELIIYNKVRKMMADKHQAKENKHYNLSNFIKEEINTLKNKHILDIARLEIKYRSPKQIKKNFNISSVLELLEQYESLVNKVEQKFNDVCPHRYDQLTSANAHDTQKTIEELKEKDLSIAEIKDLILNDSLKKLGIADPISSLSLLFQELGQNQHTTKSSISKTRQTITKIHDHDFFGLLAPKEHIFNPMIESNKEKFDQTIDNQKNQIRDLATPPAISNEHQDDAIDLCLNDYQDFNFDPQSPTILDDLRSLREPKEHDIKYYQLIDQLIKARSSTENENQIKNQNIIKEIDLKIRKFISQTSFFKDLESDEIFIKNKLLYKKLVLPVNLDSEINNDSLIFSDRKTGGFILKHSMKEIETLRHKLIESLTQPTNAKQQSTSINIFCAIIYYMGSLYHGMNLLRMKKTKISKSFKNITNTTHWITSQNIETHALNIFKFTLKMINDY